MTTCAAGFGIGCGSGVLATLLGSGAFAWRNRRADEHENKDVLDAVPVLGAKLRKLPSRVQLDGSRMITSRSTLNTYDSFVPPKAEASGSAVMFQRGRSISKVDREGMYALNMQLQNAGIDTSVFGKGTAKTLEELFWELNVTRESRLTVTKDGSLKRVVKVVQVDLVVQDYLGQWQHLVSTTQFLGDGRQRNRRDVISRKIRDGESYEEAITAAFLDRICLTKAQQDLHLVFDADSPPEETEFKNSSQGFPGLEATYAFSKVKVMIRDPTHPDLRSIGLPDCRDFVTVKSGEGNVGTNLRMWAWECTLAPTPSVSPQKAATIASAAAQAPKTESRQRAPVPEPWTLAADLEVPVKAPNAMLRGLLKGRETDWDRGRRAAARIRDRDYSLRMFHEDCVAAFPEIRLYLADSSITTSGRTGDEEYQRTIGALYAVYWLMRVDLDGKEGFCFGVDADWRPRGKPVGEIDASGQPELSATDKKRIEFFTKTNWSWFTELFAIAGLLKEEFGSVPGEAYSVCPERTLAMLALTAIHDIMKVAVLLPTVQPEHSPFRGYKDGDAINDHDIALGYVLEKYTDILPSFAGLPPRQRQAVEFTQSKMDYNMGWLVQAEAPPGALFQGFKHLLKSGGVSSTDVSFYFVHWLTDLAGAEPCPLQGAEKFVLKFPHPVLQSFLRSFPVVQELAHSSETVVFENYLVMRWKEANDPELGELPAPGEQCIAKLRLFCQAQGNAKAVLKAFQRLTDEERKLLGTEMARTGCNDQRYSISDQAEVNGPAMLVYYAPALLQKLGATEADYALRCLCEVYRQARLLWPADAAKSGEPVTVRIDTIKDRTQQQVRDAMVAGNVFMLVKHNEKEAFVELHPIGGLNDLCVSMPGRFRFLRLA